MVIEESPLCPICKSPHVVKLFNTDSLAVARHLLNADKMHLKEICMQKVEKIWGSKEADFYGCLECTFEFARPFIAGDADFYAFVYNAENSYPSEKWEYSVTIESLAGFIKISGVYPRLLEIGAGNGSFLKMISGIHIPPKEIYATEFSTTGAKSIGSMGITCFKKDLQQLSETDLAGKINIVCLFQVLEHLAGINEFFEKLNELTIPGARMYVSVPNNLQRRFFDKHGVHYDLPPVHIGRYNFMSMTRLSERHGWKLLQNKAQPSAYKQRILKFIYSAYSRKQLIFNPEKAKWKPLKLLMRYAMITVLLILNIKILIGLKNSKLGVAQWFELERIT